MKYRFYFLYLKKFVFIVSIGLAYYPLKGQGFNFTQFEATPTFINPAIMSGKNNLIAAVHYRNQKMVIENWNSSLFTLICPLKIRNSMPKAGIGFSVLDDRYTSDQNYAFQNLSLNFSYRIKLTKYTSVMAGIQSAYNQKKISSISGTTGNQYQVERGGFDPGLPSGEHQTIFKNAYINWGIGFQLISKDTSKFDKFWLSGSLLQSSPLYLNSSWSTGAENSTLILYGRYRILKSALFQLFPDVFLYNYLDQTICAGGITGSFPIKNKSKNPYIFDLTARTSFSRSYSAILKLTMSSFIMGLSYEIPYGANSYKPLTGNITELMAAYQLPIKGKKEPERKKRKRATRKDAKHVSPTLIKPSVKKKERPTFDSIQKVAESKLKIDSMISPSPLGKKNPPIHSLENTEALNRGNVLSEKLNKNLQFNVNSLDINSNSLLLLNEIAELLIENKQLKLIVIGHTDNVGNKEKNKILSEKRALVIKDYLVRKNVQPERIMTKGMGDKNPVVPNTTDENRSKNRRVEFVLFQ